MEFVWQTDFRIEIKFSYRIRLKLPFKAASFIVTYNG
jgi:hypothetical protein